MVRSVLGHPDPGRVPTMPPDPPAFHRALPGYAPTALVPAPALAAAAGIAEAWVKDESSRFGLPAFKFLGASWATARVLGATQGDMGAMGAGAADAGVRRLVAATDGNHGRAVARIARLTGLEARIFVPAAMRPARREAISGEGAELVVVDGDYDDAVATAAAEGADPAARVVNDADQDGTSPVPGWVIEGYATLFAELDAQLSEREAAPRLLALQMGVGALAAAGVAWAASRGVAAVGVEPETAACVAASLAAGRPVAIPTTGTAMAGLDCGTPSAVAWPALAAGLAGVVCVSDAEADEAARVLARDGIEAGESGAAGAAGVLALCTDPALAELRAAAGGDGIDSVVVINTEGATDPERYARVLSGAEGDA